MSTYLHLVNTHIQVLTSVCVLYEPCRVCVHVCMCTYTKTNQIATNGKEKESGLTCVLHASAHIFSKPKTAMKTTPADC